MAKASIKSTMRKTVNAVLDLSDNGQVFLETEDARYEFADLFEKFNKEDVTIAVTLNEEE